MKVSEGRDMAINVYGEKYKQYWNNGAHGMLMSTVHKLLEFSYLNVRSGKTNNIRILEIGGGGNASPRMGER
jgi:hypothetical protein